MPLWCQDQLVLESYVSYFASDGLHTSPLPFQRCLLGRSWKSCKAESCPNNNISPGALTGPHCSLSVKWYARQTCWPPSPQLKPGMAWPLWAEGLAWQSHSVGLTGPTCQHSRGLADISIHGCTDPLTCSVDLSFSYLYLPPSALICTILFLSACQFSLPLISLASIDHSFPPNGLIVTGGHRFRWLRPFTALLKKWSQCSLNILHCPEEQRIRHIPGYWLPKVCAVFRSLSIQTQEC